MNDNKHFCEWCEELFDEVRNDNGPNLCEECNNKYQNETGYCSLSCCMGNGCDETC